MERKNKRIAQQSSLLAIKEESKITLADQLVKEVEISAKAVVERDTLRKALEEAKAEYSKEGTDIQVLRRMIKIIDGVLGEGDKK